jgi:hypothetical protein
MKTTFIDIFTRYPTRERERSQKPPDYLPRKKEE